jgi:hypothetical protein
VSSRALCLLLLCAVGCAKKEPKPLRTEPWLAHPPASASASGDAALPLTRYALGERSVVRFEIPTKRGTLSGALTRVSGELELNLSDLTQSRALVRAELGSLEIHASNGAAASERDLGLLERARAALELSADAAAPAVFASFDLTGLEDVAPTAIEPAPERDGSASSNFSRHARLTAVGNLLLHGFRVVRRAPVSAEFMFEGARQLPHSVVIRSRAPFVVTLETHAIVALAPEGRTNIPGAAATQAREARVSVELYATKLD